jgi:hypothetical protein
MQLCSTEARQQIQGGAKIPNQFTQKSEASAASRTYFICSLVQRFNLQYTPGKLPWDSSVHEQRLCRLADLKRMRELLAHLDSVTALLT